MNKAVKLEVKFSRIDEGMYRCCISVLDQGVFCDSILEGKEPWPDKLVVSSNIIYSGSSATSLTRDFGSIEAAQEWADDVVSALAQRYAEYCAFRIYRVSIDCWGLVNQIDKKDVVAKIGESTE